MIANEPTRRALIGGAGLVAVAALARCGTSPAHAAVSVDTDRCGWNAAVAHCTAARADFDRALEIADNAPMRSPEYRAALIEETRTSAIDTKAMEVLLATPAPDFAAVAYKVEMARDHELSLDGVLADLRRFAEREG